MFSYYLPWAIVIDQGRRGFEKKEKKGIYCDDRMESG